MARIGRDAPHHFPLDSFLHLTEHLNENIVCEVYGFLDFNSCWYPSHTDLFRPCQP
jgi:hypothetical protein